MTTSTSSPDTGPGVTDCSHRMWTGGRFVRPLTRPTARSNAPLPQIGSTPNRIRIKSNPPPPQIESTSNRERDDLPQIECATATTDVHLHIDGGRSGVNEASASMSTGRRSAGGAPKIDDCRGDGGSTNALKKMKQIALSRESGKRNGHTVLKFFKWPSRRNIWECDRAQQKM